MKKKLIFIELNEINFDILKKYSKRVNFKFFNEDLLENLKITKSEDIYDHLEPWIQWVSVHTGLTAKEHKIFRLGDISNSNLLQIFEIIESKGFQVSAICPMNTKNDLKKSKYFIPDPWTKTTTPKNFLQNLIYKTLVEAVNNNTENKLSFKNRIVVLFISIYFFKIKNFFRFCKYYYKSLKQKWYRAIIFDYLIHKIHTSYLKRFDVDFSTIFFNAGAHIQHHYLHNSRVIEDKVIKNPNWYVQEKYDPILDVYFFYDEILLEYLENDYSILIATGLTQSPYIEKEYYYRLKDHEKFIKKLSINFKSIYPRMSRDFLITFECQKDCLKAAEVFNFINQINNAKFFELEIRYNSIFVIFCYNKEINNNLKMKIGYNVSINLKNYINFVALKNGKHDQKGYMTSIGNFKNYLPPNNSHVKEIFKSINDYFNSK